jgi:Poly(3-hydroxybutyrate) depolymerase
MIPPLGFGDLLSGNALLNVIGSVFLTILRMKIPLAALALLITPVLAQNPDWDAGSRPTAHLEEAQFRWWAPEAKTLRGVMVVIPGRNGDGRNAVNDPDWQALATKHHFALVGCRLFKEDPTYQSDPDGSTAKMIEKAVSELGRANGHPEVANAPLVFWGHSAGSNTAERFAFRHPKRTLAIAGIKGTWGPGDATPQKCDVPILACIGKNDKPDWVATATKNYEAGRQGRAVWALALNPGEGHETGATKPLAVTFLDEVITLRLGPPDNMGSSGGPKKLSVSSGWLGDPSTLETAPASSFRGKKRDATWLPGELTAAAWKSYLSKP